MIRSYPRASLPLLLGSILAVAGCGKGGPGAKDPLSSSGGGSSSEFVGKAPPDLSIQTLNGKGKISLESLQGKIVILDFWATWCAPCKQSFPKLEELSKKIGDRVEIVGISVDDDQKGILDFAKETGVTFPLGWDEGHKLAGSYKVKTMPTTFILDASGKVRYVHDGYHDGEASLMGKEVAALADEPAPDTKMAKSDKPAEAKPADGKTDAKTDAKPEPLADSSTTNAPAAAEPEPAPPRAEKKGGKKGGRGAGKKAPPAGKKKGAKKKV